MELSKKHDIEEVGARTSKLSARMRRIATPEEFATLRTPFLMLADLTQSPDLGLLCTNNVRALEHFLGVSHKLFRIRSLTCMNWQRQPFHG
jgi:hypothetical protein